MLFGTPKQNRTAHTINQLYVPYELGVALLEQGFDFFLTH